MLVANITSPQDRTLDQAGEKIRSVMRNHEDYTAAEAVKMTRSHFIVLRLRLTGVSKADQWMCMLCWRKSFMRTFLTKISFSWFSQSRSVTNQLSDFMLTNQIFYW